MYCLIWFYFNCIAFKTLFGKGLWKIIKKKERNTHPPPRPGPKAEAQQFSPFPLRAAQPAQLPARRLPPPFPPLSVTAAPAPHVSSPPSFFTRRSRVGRNRRQPKSRFSRDLACRDQTEPYKAPSDAPRLVFPPEPQKPSPSGLPHPVLDLADSLPISPRGHTTPGSLRPK